MLIFQTIYASSFSLAFLLSITSWETKAVQADFNPFMDSDLYSITWDGPINLDKKQEELLADRHMLITTNKDENYRCIVPDLKQQSKDPSSAYAGPTAAKLLEPLFKQSQCSYRLESFWTYELCHGKHLKQYHETKEPGSKPLLQEYYLGFGNQKGRGTESQKESEEVTDGPFPKREVDGVELAYYEILMDDGTKCDLTNTPRKAHVMYVCQTEGRGEVYELKESSTCEYEVVVLTSLLCRHPKFRPKSPPVNEIRCYSFEGSPLKPSELSKVEVESNALRRNNIPPQTTQAPHSTLTPVETHTPYRKPETTAAPPAAKLGAVTDKQTLREFFGGRHCLTGGGGWWRHEVCFGKYARQFHQEKGVDSTIFLGTWDKKNHLAWLEANPLKRPKHKDVRKYISHYYTNGDKCDLTQKPRSCEVRLKCIENTKTQHAVILSLTEPSPCSYVLTIESNLFCAILKEADDDAMLDNLEF